MLEQPWRRWCRLAPGSVSRSWIRIAAGDDRGLPLERCGAIVEVLLLAGFFRSAIAVEKPG